MLFKETLINRKKEKKGRWTRKKAKTKIKKEKELTNKRKEIDKNV